jgi:hypothetical protein
MTLDPNAIDITAQAWMQALSEGDRYILLAGRRWTDGVPMSEDEAVAMAAALATLAKAPQPDMDALKAFAAEYGDHREYGYKVLPFDENDHSRGWMLLDPSGSNLQIGGEGGISRRKSSAILEAYRRIDGDSQAARQMGVDPRSFWADLKAGR